MHVKRVTPFNVRVKDLTAAQVFIGEHPQNCGDNKTSEQEIHNDHVEQKVNTLTD